MRRCHDAIAPHSAEGGSISFMGADDQDRIRLNDKGNHDRLVEIKGRYDPDNLFHLNQDIRP